MRDRPNRRARWFPRCLCRLLCANNGLRLRLDGLLDMGEPTPKIKIVCLHCLSPACSIDRSRDPHGYLRLPTCHFGHRNALSREQLQGALAPDLSAATYQIHDESHTLGNALRWMLMKKYVLHVSLRMTCADCFTLPPAEQSQGRVLWI